MYDYLLYGHNSYYRSEIDRMNEADKLRIQREYTAADHEGFKVMFPDEVQESEPVEVIDFIEPEKCYDETQIEKSWQLRCFEQYGWFYKD